MEDLSLSEIAENAGISKQGVRDMLLRAEKSLIALETDLGFAARFRELSECAAKLERLLSAGNTAAALTVVKELKEWL